MPSIAANPIAISIDDRISQLRMDLYRFIRIHQEKPKKRLATMIKIEFIGYTTEEIQDALSFYL